MKKLSYIIALVGLFYLIGLAGTDDYYTALHQVHAVDMKGIMLALAMMLQLPIGQWVGLW